MRREDEKKLERRKEKERGGGSFEKDFLLWFVYLFSFFRGLIWFSSSSFPLLIDWYSCL
jgi:hypothetical protein